MLYKFFVVGVSNVNILSFGWALTLGGELRREMSRIFIFRFYEKYVITRFSLTIQNVKNLLEGALENTFISQSL